MFAVSVEKFGKKASYTLYLNITSAYSIKVESQLDRKILNIFECASRATCPESKNRRPHLSLCEIILRLKRDKRGSCSYFWTSFKPPDLTYVRFRLKRFKWGHTLWREKCLWGCSRSKRFLSVKRGWKIKYRC